MKITVLFFLATLLVATSHAIRLSNPIRLYGDESLEDGIPSGSGGLYSSRQVNCLSWRLAVETDNMNNWDTIPSNCIQYVGNYMQGKQFTKDVNLVADIAIGFAKNQTLTSDGKDVWIFGFGDTAVSNVPYYNRSDVQFGAYPFNSIAFNEWVAEAAAPAIPAVLQFYKKVFELGIKAVFITGTYEHHRDAVAANLKNVGYTTWEKLILKGKAEIDESEEEFKTKKRTELVEKGYRIIGNIGDQWSDLDGENAGKRIFKVPNPMYYDG